MDRTTLASWTTTAGLLLTAPNVFAQITVEQDGSGDHTTITAAISAAPDGSTILIGPGTYAEGPISFLGKELTLDGVDPATRIVQAAADGDSVLEVAGASFQGCDGPDPAGGGREANPGAVAAAHGLAAGCNDVDDGRRRLGG